MVAEKVIPINKEEAELQETEIEAAKQAALDASQKEYCPTDLPAYDAGEKEPSLVQTA